MISPFLLVFSLLGIFQDGSGDPATGPGVEAWPKGALEALERIRTPEGISKRIIAAGPLVTDDA